MIIGVCALRNGPPPRRLVLAALPVEKAADEAAEHFRLRGVALLEPLGLASVTLRCGVWSSRPRSWAKGFIGWRPLPVGIGRR
jgi:hypothetical protein